jgi:hypothetical protein
MLESDLLKILRSVRSGELSVQEGAERLGALEEDVLVLPPTEPDDENITAGLGWWKHAWLIPLGAGTGLFMVSAFFTSWAYVNDYAFWFYCSWLPLFFGLTVLLLGLWSAQARWVHLRIHEEKGKRINISMPLPLALPSFILRHFSTRIPAMKEKHMQDLPAILDALRYTKEPISVEVDEKDGDRVRIYIL